MTTPLNILQLLPGNSAERRVRRSFEAANSVGQQQVARNVAAATARGPVNPLGAALALNAAQERERATQNANMARQLEAARASDQQVGSQALGALLSTGGTALGAAFGGGAGAGVGGSVGQGVAGLVAPQQPPAPPQAPPAAVAPPQRRPGEEEDPLGILGTILGRGR